MAAPKLRLISATPSPYARKVRVVLAEKGIPFELQTEVPWDSTTATPRHNPLEKLPILLVPKPESTTNGSSHAATNGNDASDTTAVFESHFILEWLEAKHPTPAMLPPSADQKLAAREIEVVCDGLCDALVLRLWERKREPEHQSGPWTARQERKIAGAVRWLGEKVEASGADGVDRFLVGDGFGLADVAAGCVLGYMDVRAEDIKWAVDYPVLKRYLDGLMQRQSFKDTVPYAQSFTDKIV